MTRLIDADVLDNALTKLRFNADGEIAHWGDRRDWCLHGSEVETLIADAPTVDAEPVKHGHWTIEDIITYERSYGGTLYEPVYKCSCCGRVTESYVRGDEPIMPEDADFPKFCGNCGAKMDEVEDDKR